ncbi:MAG: mechanosensitive ion channel family protein [Acidimicrobiia bacterium]|nr:mechanosensitive ion channel family protein [Acidimicrobiia bacterium]
MQAQSQSELEQIADSLEPINLDWLSLAIAAAVFLASIVLARFARRGLRQLAARVDIGSPALWAASARISSWLIIFFGMVGSLRVLGIDFIPLMAGLGVAAVVVAVALRPFLENFAAGLTLQLQRPIEVGDQIAVRQIEGEVKELNARTVVIRTMDGRTVHIPNSSVLESPITNFTDGPQRRSVIDVGLAYDTNLAEAVEVMIDAVAAAPGVIQEPPPEAFIHEFGDSTINARVRFWHEPQIRAGWTIRHEVAVVIKRALDERDIEIAFPQRVLWQGETGAEPAIPELG